MELLCALLQALGAVLQGAQLAVTLKDLLHVLLHDVLHLVDLSAGGLKVGVGRRRPDISSSAGHGKKTLDFPAGEIREQYLLQLTVSKGVFHLWSSFLRLLLPHKSQLGSVQLRQLPAQVLPSLSGPSGVRARRRLFGPLLS